MAIDMEQFKATFIEESAEGLETMEGVLLSMEPGSKDSEAIDTIFRAAHSIKGGSATFGFDDIASFTHIVETLLDEIRDGTRELTGEAISLFLSSVDCVRDMLVAAQSGEEPNRANIEQVKVELQQMLQGEDAAAGLPTASAESSATVPGWNIHFKPFADMLRSGNDVVRMFRELSELGEVEVQVNTDGLPPLTEMEAEESFLSWDVVVKGDVSRQQIDEIFEWVEDDCELSLSEITSVSVQPQATAPAESQAAVAAQIPAADAVPPAQSQAPLATQEAGADDRRKTDRRKPSSTAAESASIRVSTDKVDALINMVGELVITQSMLSQLGEDFQMDRVEKLKDGLAELERNTRELQENVMQIRMLPINFAFNRFPRMVHDLSKKLGKKIELKMSGEQTELDKTVMEKIGDPLVHLVRNSIDHGIERPEVRRANGKPETGVVHLNAFHQGGNIMIEIHDDGAGLNREKILAKAVERGLISANSELSEEQVFDLLFQPGFSTADQVSDVSGRGVGMDVVKRNIMALGGGIDVKSEQGKGSTFTIRLPLTLAILDGQLVRVGEQTYIVPLISIVESLQVKKEQVNAIAGKAEIYQLRDEYLPIIRLYETFSVQPDSVRLEDGLLVIVEGNGQRAGLLVDDLLGQQQVVIKSLETNFKRVDGLSGATILGDGTVALIVDTAGIIRLYQEKRSDARFSGSKGQQDVAA